jgi:hypothetical protein
MSSAWETDASWQLADSRQTCFLIRCGDGICLRPRCQRGAGKHRPPPLSRHERRGQGRIPMDQLRGALSAATLVADGPAVALEALGLYARSVEGAESTTHTVTYSSVGHPPPVLLARSGPRPAQESDAGPARPSFAVRPPSQGATSPVIVRVTRPRRVRAPACPAG